MCVWCLGHPVVVWRLIQTSVWTLCLHAAIHNQWYQQRTRILLQTKSNIWLGWKNFCKDSFLTANKLKLWTLDINSLVQKALYTLWPLALYAKYSHTLHIYVSSNWASLSSEYHISPSGCCQPSFIAACLYARSLKCHPPLVTTMLRHSSGRAPSWGFSCLNICRVAGSVNEIAVRWVKLVETFHGEQNLFFGLY